MLGDNGIGLSELVDNLLKMGAWGTHDPFMSSAMRADATDAKLAQVRSHDETLRLVEARRALRMATTAKGLHASLHRAGDGRAVDGGGEGEDEPSGLEAMYQSRAATAARAVSKPPDPLAGNGACPPCSSHRCRPHVISPAIAGWLPRPSGACPPCCLC